MLHKITKFDVNIVTPRAKLIAASFLLTISEQLTCMKPSGDMIEDALSLLTTIFRKALLLRGILDESPQNFGYLWIPTAMPFAKVDMDEVRGWDDAADEVVASVFPGIYRVDRDGSWAPVIRAQVYGRPKAKSNM